MENKLYQYFIYDEYYNDEDYRWEKIAYWSYPFKDRAKCEEEAIFRCNEMIKEYGDGDEDSFKYSIEEVYVL